MEPNMKLAAEQAYKEIEQAVIYLCKQSKRPGDEPDILAMKLGAAADHIGAALHKEFPEND